MKYLKKFESQDNLKEELLEYFIDMDKNYGGRWDVNVECLLPTGVDFYRIKIESKSGANIDFREFLVEFSARVKMAISMGNFKLHYHGQTDKITVTPPSFGTYDLEATKTYGTHLARIPMIIETYDDIDAIVKRLLGPPNPLGTRYHVKPKHWEDAAVKFNRLMIFFSQVRK